MTDVLAVGDVWRYPFRWGSAVAAGKAEKRPEWPGAVVVLIRSADGALEALMVPITSTPQSSGNSLPVPEIETRRAGLDAHPPLWVVTDEVNADVLGESYYFEAGQRLGAFSSNFTKQIQAQMVSAIQARKFQREDR
ncbi:hypothetical protein [Paenirhodobacter sp. CAU 1674]|uniref:hypothetical protein n=1 Tax=Paenirhodobacter sp. CAU 1674 TaxID=3032596 RepID=UPI0023DA42F2|nr:hypothetical protein [Paenirhodobacter sp. CAU 1674]MDF2143287.1 hypothetical protein [Paenirhodobacter sp. CAU 1674]